MHLPALLTTLAILSVAFAGCSDGGGEGDGQTSSSTSTSRAATSSSSSSSSATSSSTATSSSSTGTTGPANQAPSGSVSAAVNGTDVTFSLTGTDPDGDGLSWTLDFGDDSAAEEGTTLPATVEHTFAVGNYTANFTVTDGTDSKSYEVDVAVTASAAGPVQTVSGSFPLGGPLTECGLGAYVGAPAEGTTYAFFAVDPATYGKAFTITISAAVPPVPDGTFMGEYADGAGLDFVDAAGDYIESFGGDVDVPIVGIVTDGAPSAAVWSCGGAMIEFTYSAG